MRVLEDCQVELKLGKASDALGALQLCVILARVGACKFYQMR